MKIILSSNTDWYLYNYRLPLAFQLKAHGWDVVMMSPAGEFVEKIEAAGIRWLNWPLGRKTTAPWSEWAAIRAAERIYREERPDIAHHNTIKPNIYGSIAAKRAGVPGIVNSITGRGYVFLGEDLRARSLRRLVLLLYRRAFQSDNVRAIFENPADRAYFIRNGLMDEGRTFLIASSGVDPERFYCRPEPDGRPVVLMASRMLWDKGVAELVEAAKRIGAPRHARVVLVGTPDEGNPNAIPRRQLEAWHAEGTVEWWGFRGDMPEVLGQCHIFTLPTKYAEGLPVSLLEAAASCRAIVTTRMPGPQDFVVDGETGLLVPPGDVSALAEALQYLIDHPAERTAMAAAGRSRVETQFTSEIINRRTMAVYDALLKKSAA